MAFNETISDGYGAHLVTPEGPPAPGIVVLQEIFGVNDYIRSVCDRVAAMGYVAHAPHNFWRMEPEFAVEPSQGDEGMGRGFAKMGEYDWSHTTVDLQAAVDHLKSSPHCDGRIAIMGFCFGGSLTFHAACTVSPDCAISYYGSGIAGMLDEHADNISCPTLIHFGGDDPYLPREDADAVAERFAGVDHVDVLVQAGAGHAFDNDINPVFSNPEAAAAAWTETTSFLAEHLPIY
jgi:carboxymethylenebutenolidase